MDNSNTEWNKRTTGVKTGAQTEINKGKRTFNEVFQSLGKNILLGIVCSILLIFLFVFLTQGVFSNQFLQFDDGFELWLHSQSNSALDLFFNFMTLIGGIGSIAVISVITAGFLFWRKHYHTAWILLLGVGGGIALNQALKEVFHRARPELWTVTGGRLSTYSFPSGHATVSLCYFGLLIWMGLSFIKRPALQILWSLLMIFLILSVGLSRIYLGEHFPTDVLGAYISGGSWLLILLSGTSAYTRYRKQFSSPPLIKEKS